MTHGFAVVKKGTRLLVNYRLKSAMQRNIYIVTSRNLGVIANSLPHRHIDIKIYCFAYDLVNNGHDKRRPNNVRILRFSAVRVSQYVYVFIIIIRRNRRSSRREDVRLSLN